LTFGALTRIQAGYWTDSATLFQHALNVTRNNYVAQINLAMAFEEQRDRRRAEAEYFNALSAKPAPNFKSVVFLRLGKIKASEQKWDEAEHYFRESIKTAGSHLSYTELGNVLAKTGRLQEAEQNFRYAIIIAPAPEGARDARLGLGIALAEENRNAEAIAQFKELLKLGPDASVLYLLGEAEQQTGNLPGAVNAFRNALRLEPEYTQARQKLDSILPSLQDANTPK
jgi:tetratricopeptide (TPR) repeat protein